MIAMMDPSLRERLRAGALRTAGGRGWNRIFDDLLMHIHPQLPVLQAV